MLLVTPKLSKKLFFRKIQYGGLPETLQKYQNPKEADAMSRVQAELDETKIILVLIFILFVRDNRVFSELDASFDLTHCIVGQRLCLQMKLIIKLILVFG